MSAAVSLKDAFSEIGALYEGSTGVKVTFNFGSSGTLERQIETGAPVDVFASAGQAQMDSLAGAELIDLSTRIDFARNKLVVILPRTSNVQLTALSALTGSEIGRIAVGNPKTVPAGQYAAQALNKAGISQAVGSKLVFGEDVRQVLDYVVRGEVDAGIVYATDAAIAGEQVRIAATVPEDFHQPILYPISVVRSSHNREAAIQFVEFVRSKESSDVLVKYGFSAVQ
ncbi:MAG: molybdate ABC transporter substrate-binding protein [Pyrinomonadaceae bacterium]